MTWTTSAPHVRNLPAAVYHKDRLVSHSWDVECATRDRFMAVTQGTGGASVDLSGDGALVRFAPGEARLTLGLLAQTSFIERQQRLTCLSDGLLLQDFVARMKVPRDVFPTAHIAGQTIEHRGKNVWYQYATDHLDLFGPSGLLELSAVQVSTMPGFRLDCYVRDMPGEDWVVHVRLMPHPPSSLWLRWDTRLGRVVDFRNQRSLRALQQTSLGRRLWYLAERRGGRPNGQLMGLARLSRHDEIGINVQMRMRSHD